MSDTEEAKEENEEENTSRKSKKSLIKHKNVQNVIKYLMIMEH